MTTAKEIAAKLGMDAGDIGKQLRRLRDRLRSAHQLASRVFCGDDGEPTAASAEWLRRLARDNFVESRTYRGDKDQMLINEGRRALALEILVSVHFDAERLGALTRLEREIE